MSNVKLAYISFDVVPAPKGAATHIEAFTKSLATTYNGLELITVSPTAEIIPRQERWPSVYHTALPAIGKTLIHRVLYFREYLKAWLKGRYFQVIHIRSIYEGFPIALEKSNYCKDLVFEVNGLPSIELKYRYPNVEDDRELTGKLKGQENVCFAAADLIITPSQVTCNYLISKGVSDAKIKVIPNGVDLTRFPFSPPSLDTLSIMGVLYFGTLSSWQGVDLAIRAIALCEFPVQLEIIGSASKAQVRELTRLVSKLGISDRVYYFPPVSQEELVTKIHTSDAILAPLTLCDRNLVQGCCPFKILEGMTTGTPVIASNLPVVRELGKNNQHFRLVKPNSVEEIKVALTHFRNSLELRKSLAYAAREHIDKHYTWEQANAKLSETYQLLVTNH